VVTHSEHLLLFLQYIGSRKGAKIAKKKTAKEIGKRLLSLTPTLASLRLGESYSRFASISEAFDAPAKV
jgi:hypothetical protein